MAAADACHQNAVPSPRGTFLSSLASTPHPALDSRPRHGSPGPRKGELMISELNWYGPSSASLSPSCLGPPGIAVWILCPSSGLRRARGVPYLWSATHPFNQNKGGLESGRARTCHTMWCGGPCDLSHAREQGKQSICSARRGSSGDCSHAHLPFVTGPGARVVRSGSSEVTVHGQDTPLLARRFPIHPPSLWYQ